MNEKTLFTAALKRFFAGYGHKVKVRSSSGKGQWIDVWMPSLPGGMTLRYDQPAFSLDLRVHALRIIYPTHPNLWTGNAGNVNGYSIAMTKPEWIKFLNSYRPGGMGPGCQKCGEDTNNGTMICHKCQPEA